MIEDIFISVFCNSRYLIEEDNEVENLGLSLVSLDTTKFTNIKTTKKVNYYINTLYLVWHCLCRLQLTQMPCWSSVDIKFV